MERFVLAVDQGTTSSRAILFNRGGEVVGVAQKEFKQHYPKPGWVEHDPIEILETQGDVIRAVIEGAGIAAAQIVSVGITNQRETVVVWDRDSGKPIYPAIVWQCRRTSDYCQKMRDAGAEDDIKSRTGLFLDPYFSASKIGWILDNVAGAREKANNGQLLFGTIDSWLIYNFSPTHDHITDDTNASRTMLYNIKTNQWDQSLFNKFAIPRSMAPRIVASSGALSILRVLDTDIPITGIAGDQQAALFGQRCWEPGDMKCTYGTGCFLLCNVGKQPVVSNHKLLTTVAWRIGDEVTYCLEGSVFIGGAVIQWMRDELGLIKDAAESEAMANQVTDTDGVFVVPAFAGLGAPHWDSEARGLITGITRGTNKNHLIRAALESIALQSEDVMKAMAADMKQGLSTLKVDGGASMNGFLMQFQSDISGISVESASMHELTGLGVAFLSGLAVGFWDGAGALPIGKDKTVYQADKSEKWRGDYYHNWQNALNRAKSGM